MQPIRPLIGIYIQKVLPAVYDDSLSYYEILCKALAKINEMVDVDNNIIQLINNLENELENIGTIPEIDAKIADLQETANSLDDALDTIQATLDALPSYEQFTALSTEVDELGEDIETRIPWPDAPYVKYGTDGQVLRTNGDGTTQWQEPLIPTDEQAETYISAWLANHPEATTTVENGSITFVKFSNELVDGIENILSLNTDSDEVTDWKQGRFAGSDFHETTSTQRLITTSPHEAGTYIVRINAGFMFGYVVRSETPYSDGFISGAGNYLIVSEYPIDFTFARTPTDETTVDDASNISVTLYARREIPQPETPEVVTDLTNYVGVPLYYDVYATATNRCIYTNGSVRSASGSYLGFCQIYPIDVEGLEYVICPVYHGPLNIAQLSVAFYESTNVSTFVEGVEFVQAESVSWVDTLIKVPDGAKIMISVFDVTSNNGNPMRGLKKKPLAGMRLSVLSDSMSAYTGYIPEGNRAYYEGDNAGVDNVNEMWWKRLCDSTGMEPLVIDAWSGSTLAYNARVFTNPIPPMCSDLRTSRLHDGDVNPDIIILSGGTNDYHFNAADLTQLGTMDDSITTIDRESVLAGTSTFVESYASTIQQLQLNYPNAIIVCASLYFCGYTFPFKHNDCGKTGRAYNEAIKTVCEYMGVPYIDIYDIGFNRNNYSLYAIDNVNNPVHTNAAGQAVIAEKYVKELVPIVEGYLEVKRYVA